MMKKTTAERAVEIAQTVFLSAALVIFAGIMVATGFGCVNPGVEEPEPGAISFTEPPANHGGEWETVRGVCRTASSGEPLSADLLVNGHPVPCVNGATVSFWWRGSSQIWVEGSPICPVSPCGYLRFEGLVDLIDPDVDPPDDHRSADRGRVFFVDFESRAAR